jgi:hypothetical protein
VSETDLAVAAIASSDVEAAAMVSALADGGVEAKAAPAAPSWTGRVSISTTSQGVPVLVRQADLQRARTLLADNASDSADIDWDQVDVGERVDNVPLRPVGRMPLMAKLAWVIAMIVLLVSAILTVIVILI